MMETALTTLSLPTSDRIVPLHATHADAYSEEEHRAKDDEDHEDHVGGPDDAREEAHGAGAAANVLAQFRPIAAGGSAVHTRQEHGDGRS